MADKRMPDSNMASENAKKRLIRLLQDAHAGELAAALAYEGHSRSVRDQDERTQIEKIRDEELHHRKRLYEMLVSMGAAPRKLRELRMRSIGLFIWFICLVSGWFIPMYGAGKLEQGNIIEYEVAARLAFLCGQFHLIEEILTFAEVEWDHELFFREKAASHWMIRIVPIWDRPGPREDIRKTYQVFSMGSSHLV